MHRDELPASERRETLPAAGWGVRSDTASQGHYERSLSPGCAAVAKHDPTREECLEAGLRLSSLSL